MNTNSNHPLTVTTDSFASDVLERSYQSPVLVDFWAAWCGPCKALTAPLAEIAAERAGQLVVAKVDVDANADLAAQFHVRSIPALLVFRDGQPQEMLVGLHSKAEILQHVDRLAPSVSPRN